MGHLTDILFALIERNYLENGTLDDYNADHLLQYNRACEKNFTVRSRSVS
jgi:hypothetical protein